MCPISLVLVLTFKVSQVGGIYYDYDYDYFHFADEKTVLKRSCDLELYN